MITMDAELFGTFLALAIMLGFILGAVFVLVANNKAGRK
jgi:hypothetical protein